MGIPRNGGLAMQNMFYSSFNHALNGGVSFLGEELIKIKCL